MAKLLDMSRDIIYKYLPEIHAGPALPATSPERDPGYVRPLRARSPRVRPRRCGTGSKARASRRSPDHPASLARPTDEVLTANHCSAACQTPILWW
jgi:hypothetical protein